ncbi:MAG: hypothetical protein FJW90_02320 [Actinobacteria bacterium]|nr:hypothetical protein [Actinomycetota bacterium]
MASDPTELIVGAFAAFNEGGAPAFIGCLTDRDALDEDFAMEIQADAPNGGRREGEAGFLRMADLWLEAWEEFEMPPGDPVQLSAGRYLVPTRQRVVARGSGMELEEGFFYTVQLSQGRVKRIGLFSDRSLAERDLALGADGG